MKKTAQKSPVELVSMYVLFLRALYLIHQENHWKTRGYDLHLMFQRIYEGVQEMADEAAEKAVGVYGDLVKQDQIGTLTDRLRETEDLVERSLKAEKAFQAFAKKVYETLKESDALTLGVDDMIMSHCSKSEVHTFLLQQAEKR